MTGENFIMFNHGGRIKAIKEEICKIKDELAEVENRYNVIENGFDSERHSKLVKRLEWQEYLLWGILEN